LADEFDVMEIALAAVKLAHEASGAAADEEEIPEVRPREDRPRRDGAPAGPRRERRGPSEGMTRLFLGAGRSSGIRPQDIVGALTGETDLKGRDIGAIEIADRFSLVEVPESAADEVIAALRGSSIKGRRATVRRERYQAKPRKRRG
jgi:ATP-dependent RNA helicase DeaD